MNKINESKQNIEKTDAEEQTIETFETVELENVTGGSSCGCGRPAGGPVQLGARG